MENLLIFLIDIVISVFGGLALIMGLNTDIKWLRFMFVTGGVFLIRMAPQIVSWL